MVLLGDQSLIGLDKEIYMTQREEVDELMRMWCQQQLVIEKRKAFLETLKETK